MSVESFISMFMMRNCRGGEGERMAFYMELLRIYKEYPLTTIKCLPFIPQFGYWKDLLNIIELSNNDIISRNCAIIYVDQLIDDYHRNDNKISFAAKYAPRETSHFAKKCNKYFMIIVELFFRAAHNCDSENIGLQLRFYRKSMVSLNKILDTTEIKMCSNNWREINYSNVPDLCFRKFKHAHLNELPSKGVRYLNNEDRNIARENALRVLHCGRVNSKVFFSDIIRQIDANIEIDELVSEWNYMKDQLKEKEPRMLIPICGNSRTSLLSTAITLLISELNNDKIITFDPNPVFLSFNESDTIKDKIQILRSQSTSGLNLLKVFHLLNCKDYEMLDIVIFSDSNFESTCGNTQFDIIRRMFFESNLRIPNIIFWNLHSSVSKPTLPDENNIIFMSGFSMSLFNNLLIPHYDVYSKLRRVVTESLNDEQSKFDTLGPPMIQFQQN